MTEATHTPGPWDVTFGEYDAAIHAGGTVAMIDDTMSCWRGNARLIAAAPAMLAALVDAQAMLCELEAPAHLPESDDLYERIDALIVRIEGK